MPAPFPGMDPYIEDGAVWRDFHASFLPALRRALRKVLPPGYHATLDERVSVDAIEDTRIVRPDVAVHRAGGARPPKDADGESSGRSSGSSSTGTLLLRTTVTEEIREVFLEIRSAPGKELITVVELLSPTNKRAGSETRATYLRKRNEVLQSTVHLVEIDLLRAGKRVPMADPLPDCHYLVLVSRAGERPLCTVFPLMLKDRLPRVDIPLREPEEDVEVDLQAVFDEVYDEAGYAERVDYAADPPPPSDPDFIATVRALLAR